MSWPDLLLSDWRRVLLFSPPYPPTRSSSNEVTQGESVLLVARPPLVQWEESSFVSPPYPPTRSSSNEVTREEAILFVVRSSSVRWEESSFVSPPYSSTCSSSNEVIRAELSLARATCLCALFGAPSASSGGFLTPARRVEYFGGWLPVDACSPQWPGSTPKSYVGP